MRSPSSVTKLLYPVHRRDVWKVWPKAAHFIWRALQHAPARSIESVEEWLSDTRAQLIVYGGPRDIETGLPAHVSAAVVTEFHREDEGFVLRLIAMGAESLTEAVPLLGTIEILARNKGAEAMEICAPDTRLGWIRTLRGRGYAPDRQEADGMILRKRL